MKAIILAAGYGTRLQRDLETAGDEYSHLNGLPKQLLPIAGKPLIEYLIDELEEISQIDDIYIVTNQRYFKQFKNWATRRSFPENNIINDGTASNEERLGAIKDIQYTIEEKEIDDDILVVCGDTLFPPEVRLHSLVDHFYEKGHNTVPSYTVPDSEVHRRGIIEVNAAGHINNFLEKPDLEDTDSRLACPPAYLYKRESLPQIARFLYQKRDAPLKERDAPGHLIAWLHNQTPISTCPIAGRFDVGNLAQYQEADRFFRELQQ